MHRKKIFFFLDCLLYAVGKPVYHRYTDQTYGSWMRDPVPKNDASGEMFWVTSESDSTHLYEFANKSSYRKDIPTKVYELEHPLKVFFNEIIIIIIIIINYK
mgnify:FL=1